MYENQPLVEQESLTSVILYSANDKKPVLQLSESKMTSLGHFVIESRLLQIMFP